MQPVILFRDTRFVVLDKPAGLPSHAGPRGGASVEDLFAGLSRRRDGPWLAHRLDADTAGCQLIALRRGALIEAQAAFATGRVRKTYWAIVEGEPEGECGVVALPLRKQSGPAGWRMVGDPQGQRAVTDWKVRGRGDGIAWLELHPRTGRTHQIRVHCASLGCPVLNDPIYGGGQGSVNRGKLHLLARALMLPLTPKVVAEALVPAHMQKAWLTCTQGDRSHSGNERSGAA